MKIEINQVTCQRCNHKWYPRSPEVIICPHCKSPYWNKKKVRKGKSAEVTYVPDEGSSQG